MTTMADYEDLLWTYRTPIADTNEGFRAKFQDTLDATLLRHGIPQDSADPEVNQRRTDISAGVIANMAADLSGYNALAADAVTNYNKGRFGKEDALNRTNKILGQMAGLRYFMECCKPIPLGDNLHEELDDEVKDAMQAIATNLADAIKTKDFVNVTFDIKGTGLTV